MAKSLSSRKASFLVEFFKVYLPDQSSQRLRVPPAFVKKINGTIPNNAILKDLGGKVWHVEMEEAENGLYFKNGWQRFASDHSLEFGNFLVFRYKGNSLFDVKIFGKNGCLKEEALANKCLNEETGGKTAIPVKVEEESEEEQTCSKPIHNCKRKYSELGRKRSVKSEVGGSDEVSRRKSQRIASRTIEQHGRFDASEFVIPKKLHFIPSALPTAMKRSEKSDVIGPKEVGRCKSESIASKTIEQHTAFDASEFVVSTNPHFIASFHPSTRYFLTVPKLWLIKNGIEMNPEMVLCDQNGKLWPVKIASRLDGRIAFTKGWPDFWKENSLGLNDKCLFEFAFHRGRRLSREIQVKILRARAQKLLPRYPTRSQGLNSEENPSLSLSDPMPPFHPLF